MLILAMGAGSDAYKEFEEIVNPLTKQELLGFVCYKELAKIIKEKIALTRKIENLENESGNLELGVPCYTTFKYFESNVHILILRDSGKKGRLAFAFYDSVSCFDESELACYIISSEELEKLHVTQVQIRAVNELENILTDQNPIKA